MNHQAIAFPIQLSYAIRAIGFIIGQICCVSIRDSECINPSKSIFLHEAGIKLTVVLSKAEQTETKTNVEKKQRRTTTKIFLLR